MDIYAEQLTKIYHYKPIIDKLSFHFKSSGRYAISGRNGSGKSTLIKMLSGFLSQSKGTIVYENQSQKISRKNIFRHVSIAAPYTTIEPDFNLEENFNLLQRFKPLIEETSYDSLLDVLEWKNPGIKKVAQFSSGMQQKVNVLFAFLTKSDIIFLDEPTSYMDIEAKSWYTSLFKKYGHERTIIIASNETSDFVDVDEEVLIK